MARETFTWHPIFGSQREMKNNVKKTVFGDGYEARVPIGVNFQAEEWRLTFEASRANSKQITDFLDARGSTEAFNWTTPRSKTGVFVCDGYTEKLESGYVVIDATFRQVFEF